MRFSIHAMGIALVALAVPTYLFAQDLFPPKIPSSNGIVTINSPALLKPTTTLDDGVKIAQHPPTVEVMYYPGQDYEGNPWSVWGDSLAVGDKYYSAIGDHK